MIERTQWDLEQEKEKTVRLEGEVQEKEELVRCLKEEVVTLHQSLAEIRNEIGGKWVGEGEERVRGIGKGKRSRMVVGVGEEEDGVVYAQEGKKQILAAGFKDREEKAKIAVSSQTEKN